MVGQALFFSLWLGAVLGGLSAAITVVLVLSCLQAFLS